MDIFGPPGSGKSQLCFSFCARCAADKGRVLFVDTSGRFRPERIAEIVDSDSVLQYITIVRARTLGDQQRALEMVTQFDPKLVVIDSLTSLFSVENSGSARHLALMRYLHDLAVLATNGKYHVVVTNMVRTVIQNVALQNQRRQNSKQQALREFLGASVSLYSHLRLRLDIVDRTKSLLHATLLNSTLAGVKFSVGPRGVHDPTE
jgi:RecA/RadA recombinase